MSYLRLHPPSLHNSSNSSKHANDVMSFQLLRRIKPFPIRHPLMRRHQSTTPRTQVDRVLSRLPRFLHPYTNTLRNAPASFITSFLILHEITAIVPLVGLAGLFHYTNWLPEQWTKGQYVREGIERFGRYFGRKGWFGFGAPDLEGINADGLGGGGQTSEGTDKMEGSRADEAVGGVEIERKFHVGQASGRILVEVATAYAITKVLLPARVVLSVWATPWFARVVVGKVGGLFRRKRVVTAVRSPVSKNTGSITKPP